MQLWLPLLLFLWHVLAGTPTPTPTTSTNSSPKGLIIDTDTEIDDIEALLVAYALEERGEVQLLAMASCTSHPYAVGCLDAINTYYGRGHIPVGTLKEKGFLEDKKNTFNRYVAEHWPNKFMEGTSAPDAVMLYRQVLASQPDQSIIIVSLGPLKNLASLLSSPPDSISPLHGRELVTTKVSRLCVMGGRYPSGREWNFLSNALSAKLVVEGWPTPTLFSGFEIGHGIMTGRRLWAAVNEEGQDSPIRKALELSLGPDKDFSSWDATAVLGGVRGGKDYWGVRRGNCMVDGQTGNNTWVDQVLESRTSQEYLVVSMDPALVAREIEDLMISAKTCTSSGLPSCVR